MEGDYCLTKLTENPASHMEPTFCFFFTKANAHEKTQQGESQKSTWHPGSCIDKSSGTICLPVSGKTLTTCRIFRIVVLRKVCDVSLRTGHLSARERLATLASACAGSVMKVQRKKRSIIPSTCAVLAWKTMCHFVTKEGSKDLRRLREGNCPLCVIPVGLVRH